MRSHYTLTLSYQPCYRHYRTQCRLELSFQGPSEQSARSHLSLCDHLCFHTRWSYGAIKNNFAADIGTVSDGRAEVLEQMPPGISLSVRRASCTTLPTVIGTGMMYMIHQQSTRGLKKCIQHRYWHDVHDTSTVYSCSTSLAALDTGLHRTTWRYAGFSYAITVLA